MMIDEEFGSQQQMPQIRKLKIDLGSRLSFPSLRLVGREKSKERGVEETQVKVSQIVAEPA